MEPGQRVFSAAKWPFGLSARVGPAPAKQGNRDGDAMVAEPAQQLRVHGRWTRRRGGPGGAAPFFIPPVLRRVDLSMKVAAKITVVMLLATVAAFAAMAVIEVR